MLLAIVMDLSVEMVFVITWELKSVWHVRKLLQSHVDKRIFYLISHSISKLGLVMHVLPMSNNKVKECAIDSLEPVVMLDTVHCLILGLRGPHLSAL